MTVKNSLTGKYFTLIGLSLCGPFLGHSLDSGRSFPAVAALTIGFLLVAFVSKIRQYSDLVHQFEKYHQEADDRYAELQRSKFDLDKHYQEASLLEALSKDIQRSDRLTNILNTTVIAVCEKFGFSRAAIMLIDREKKLLRTAAVAGTKEFADIIWNFSVEVSKQRDNPLVLSSVYLTGQPILISDVDAHKFQLNSASQTILSKLESSGLSIVPIPAIEGNWGVLIADKSSKTSKIERRDLVMLQRVAQHLGLALDKKAKLDQEENLRRIFQKYVPSKVVSDISNDNEPVLGGKLKDITCMFIDIRGFTKLSQQYPPELVLDILNRFFSLTQTIVGEYSGVIDKFLGDGVLATWATTADMESHTVAAVDAAFRILEETRKLSAKLDEARLPTIEIGIGINTGPALVGNVGSEERMEFTAIGPTVNLASRLEGLCKKFGSPMIISHSVLGKLTGTQLTHWSVVEGVLIKGIEQPVFVGVYSGQKKNEQVA